MRSYLSGFLFVFALAAVPVVGCTADTSPDIKIDDCVDEVRKAINA